MKYHVPTMAEVWPWMKYNGGKTSVYGIYGIDMRLYYAHVDANGAVTFENYEGEPVYHYLDTDDSS